MSSDDKLKVKVTASYYDIAETENQLLCAQIIGLIAADQKVNPKTPEQLLIEQAEEKTRVAESELHTVKYTNKELRRELDELKAKVASLMPTPEKTT